MRDLKQKARIAMGLNTPELMRKVHPGAVFTVVDKAIAFPRDQLPQAGERSYHAERYVVVLQAGLLNTTTDPCTVLVVPCSASSRAVGAADYAVPSDEPAFPKPTVAYASLLQPVLKSELVEHIGDLSADCLLKLYRVVARNVGLSGQGTVSAQTPGSLAPPPRSDK